MAEVRNHLANAWIHVGVFRVGWDNASAGDRCVTVLVVVDPQLDMSVALNGPADETASECRLILDRLAWLLFLRIRVTRYSPLFPSRFGLSDVAVEVAQMTAQACTIFHAFADSNNHRSPPNEAEEDYSRNPCIGRSLGVVGSESSGTLGFYIRKDSQYYAVTCHHVVAPTGMALLFPVPPLHL